MKDEVAIRFRRYAVYTVIIVTWAVFLVLATEFFSAVHKAKHHLMVP